MLSSFLLKIAFCFGNKSILQTENKRNCLLFGDGCYNIFRRYIMAKDLARTIDRVAKELAWKASRAERPRGFESHVVRQYTKATPCGSLLSFILLFLHRSLASSTNSSIVGYSVPTQALPSSMIAAALRPSAVNPMVLKLLSSSASKRYSRLPLSVEYT